MSISTTGEKYIPMLREGYSGYCWFYPSPETNLETATYSRIDWSADFETLDGEMSDGPTNLKNETVQWLRKWLRINHCFTLPNFQ